LIRNLIVLSALLIQTIVTGAQTLRRPVASTYTGLGAYSLTHTDVFSFSANQASLAQLKNNAAGVYGERRFLLSELNYYTAVVGVTTRSGNFGIKVNYSGFADYNETLLGLAYGRKLGNKLDVGAQFNYNSIQISNGYGNASAISFELGTVMHITDKLNAGLHINNPVGGKFGKDQAEKLSSVYGFGIGYDASEKFFISAEIEKEEDQPVNVNAGFQYKLIPQLLVRAGMATATSSAWLGLGLTIKSFRLDVTTSYHPRLGITPGVLMLYNFKPPSPKGE
jgi:long-subunit fatty acid transport protein